ncbi:LppA family lipoprotein [Nocardia bhagyanarayanae]|uniref:Putative LppA-like lipoprotein n=1 Tax=Nocardia bhagyanarayanae TaxID=1215925 RepID=A0A543EY56_9NOCA|nr:LppA family lipoprotein [Nocardia bhagyanarayanae]TQM26523.1 putative LppA-like lipoprotein [Nocardia bhagyanarayanae]
MTTGPRRQPAALRSIAALAVACLTTGGCATLLGDPAPPPSADEIAAVTAELTELPSSEVAEQQVASVVEQIAAAAAALEPALRWSRIDDRAIGPCYGPYAHTGGRRVVLPRYRTDGSLPAAAWPGFQETARALAASVGATDMLPGGSSSPDRHVTFEGGDGARWDSNTELSILADARSMTITATVGCRLPADDRPGA